MNNQPPAVISLNLPKPPLRIIGAVAVVILLLILLWTSYYTVPAGSVGGTIWSTAASSGTTSWVTTGNADQTPGATAGDSFKGGRANWTVEKVKGRRIEWVKLAADVPWPDETLIMAGLKKPAHNDRNGRDGAEAQAAEG